MQKLHIKDFSRPYALYKDDLYFFPLIGAVLEGKQQGKVFAFSSGKSFYVEHHFGFAQLIGTLEEGELQDFLNYIWKSKSFTPTKVRLYNASAQNIYAHFPQNTHSERQRFHKENIEKCSLDKNIRPVTEENIDAIEKAFSLVTRFWSSKKDFVNYAEALALYEGEEPVSLCYAAALSNNCAEIDILTHAEHQKKGYGSMVAQAFMSQCAAKGITPLWDCFTNNTGSMLLCKRLGFTAKTPPYKFLTIAR